MSDHEAIKANIQHVLNQTRTEYFSLLDDIPDDLWNLPVGPPKWNFRELMSHIELSQSLVLPKTVAASLAGKKKAFPAPPKPIGDVMNLFMGKILGRNQTKEKLREKYVRNDAALRTLLEKIRPDDWIKSTTYPAGHKTIEEQFLSHRSHFLHHAEQIRAGLKRRGRN